MNTLRLLVGYCVDRYDQWRYHRHLKRLDLHLEDLRDKEQKLQARNSDSKTVKLVLAQARWVIDAMELRRTYVVRMLQHLEGTGRHPDDLWAEESMEEVHALLQQDPDGSKAQDSLNRLQARLDEIQKKS